MMWASLIPFTNVEQWFLVLLWTQIERQWHSLYVKEIPKLSFDAFERALSGKLLVKGKTTPPS
jgi:hypothetical protein